MTGSSMGRWLLVPMLALAAIGSDHPPAGGQSCPQESDYAQQAVWSVPGSVPLVIHIMEEPQRPCVVRSRWTPEKVALVFGPAIENRRGVNSIWGPHEVTFSVRKVEVDQYRPLPGMLDSVPPGPQGTDEFETGFTDLVTRFHRAGSVNVYLWELIPGFPIGFGRSPLTGKGKATVWIESACLDPNLTSPERCARTVAHELGHALGLYHVGDSCDIVQAEFQERCRKVTAQCPESQDSERLMRKEDDRDSTARKLCPKEVEAAKQMATELK